MKYLQILLCLFLLASGTVQAQNSGKPEKAKAKTSGTDKKGKKGGKSANGGFTTSPTGLRYKIFTGKDEKGKTRAVADGRKPKEGDILQMGMEWRNGADSLIFSSYTNGMPVMLPLMQPAFKGSLEEGLMMMSPGDSAILQVNADSFFLKAFKQPLPPFVKSGSLLSFTVKLNKIQTQEEAMADQQKLMEKQKQEAAGRSQKQLQLDDQKIQAYLQQKGLKAQKTASGLYYIITQPGSGEQAAAGKTVDVHYNGTNLEGKKFDSSYDRKQPFSFTLGQGQVIKGWDEGIALLKEGSKATLIIPSSLAYGEQDRGEIIKPNTVLVFDVELLDVK